METAETPYLKAQKEFYEKAKSLGLSFNDIDSLQKLAISANTLREIEQAEVTTLPNAKKYLEQNYEKGCECPACCQMVKLYKRPLNAPMAAGLISLYKKGNGNFMHITDILDGLKGSNGGGDFAKLRYWGFIEEEANDDSAKRTSGSWKITPRGKEFVENKMKVPSHVHLYNGKRRGFAQETVVSVISALGKHFDYAELMNG